MKKFLILLAVLAACGSKSDKSADNAGGDACTVAATKAVDLSMGARMKRLEARGSGSDMSEIKAKLEEQATKFKGAMAKHCNDDKWSQDVIDCYTNAGTRDALMACRTKLTPDQQSALQKEEQALRGGNSRMGMGGGNFRRHDGSGEGSAVGSGDSAGSSAASGSGSSAGSGSAK